MEFWDLFDYLCAKKGVSRRKACEEMGFSASLASKGKYAGTRPRTEFVYACSKYFGVTIDYLMGKEEKPKDETTEAREYAFERTDLRILFDLAPKAPPSEVYKLISQLEKYAEDNNGDS